MMTDKARVNDLRAAARVKGFRLSTRGGRYALLLELYQADDLEAAAEMVASVPPASELLVPGDGGEVAP